MTGLVAAWRTSYTAGEWLVLSGPTAVVAIDPAATPRPAELEHLWNEVVRSSTMADLVARLAPLDAARSPRLLALFWDAGGLRTLVRGELTLREVSSGRAVAEGEGVVTWREVGLGEVRAVVAALPGSHNPSAGQALPLVVGAVRAGSIRVDATPDAVLVSPQLDGVLPVAEDSDALVSDVEAQGAAVPSEEEPVEGSEAIEASAVNQGDNQADVNDDDDLEHTERIDPSELPGGVSDTVSDAERDEMENGATALLPPGSAPSAPLAVPVTAPTTDLGRPRVDAVWCPQGHPNPPDAEGCWICGEDIAPQAAGPVERPVLAQLRLPDGTAISLDRPVLIGRAPSEPDSQPWDAETPRLVAVASPGGDISRTHVRIAPDGWQILVTDLHSTNGTALVSSGNGFDRVDLRPDEPLSVALGTTVELGDGVRVVIDQAG